MSDIKKLTIQIFIALKLLELHFTFDLFLLKGELKTC